jgi:hypothetical protein
MAISEFGSKASTNARKFGTGVFIDSRASENDLGSGGKMLTLMTP